MDDNLWSQLPFELKIEILEQTVELYPETTARFALISRAYQQIFEPRLYRTIEITADHSLQSRQLLASKGFALESKPASFFTQHVRQIHFGFLIPQPMMITYIRKCAHVQTISFAFLSDSYAEMILLMQTLPFLTHLYIFPTLEYPKFQDLVLPTVTHLYAKYARFIDLAPFPNLTHLALRGGYQPPPNARDILGRMPTLRALVVLVSDMTSSAAFDELAATDARVTCSHWRGPLRDFEQIWWKSDCT